MKQIEKTEEFKAMTELIIEIKLSINRRLFEKGNISEEMYIRAKEIIIKQSA